MIEPDRKTVENSTVEDALVKGRGLLPESPVNFLLARLSVNPVPGVDEFLPTGGTFHEANPRPDGGAPFDNPFLHTETLAETPADYPKNYRPHVALSAVLQAFSSPIPGATIQRAAR